MSELIRVKLEGLNAGKIVNALIQEGVFVKNLKQKTKTIDFYIEKKQESKLKQICKKHHKKYIILSEKSVVNLIRKMRYYFGFLLAVIISFVFMFVFNMYVYQVNVYVDKNANFNLESVKQILKENNITNGMRKNDINIQEIQNMIISSRQDISGCTIKQSGGCLDIVIYPALLKDNVSTEDIYSNYNAVITEVNIFAGESTLKAGDLVQVGDLLIKNNNGASGKIRGKIYYTDYLIYNENQIIKEKTGRFYESSNILLFNKKLFKKTENNKYLNYIEENCVFSLSKNTFIPISLVKTKYFEFEYKEQIVKFEFKENELKEELYTGLLNGISDKNSITNVTYSVVTENNLTRLDCFIECEIDLI